MTVTIPADKTHLLAGTMSEKQLQEHVRRLCRDLGLMHYHTHDSRRSEGGFPDSVIIGKTIIYRELKSQLGRMSRAQLGWAQWIRQAGGDWRCWRPQQLIDGTIARELQELR